MELVQTKRLIFLRLYTVMLPLIELSSNSFSSNAVSVRFKINVGDLIGSLLNP